MTAYTSDSTPSSVAVVGAGMVGLATAWHLQKRGVEVTVWDRDGVAAGASWGNAGWLTPTIATPLPEPAVLRYGARAVLSPASPVYVPPTTDPLLLTFLARFVLHSTMRRWERSMRSLIPLNNLALAAFDELTSNGVEAQTVPATPFLAAYRTAAERETLLAEIEDIAAAGQQLSFDVIDGEKARAQEPCLSGQIGAALRMHGQRYINPGAFVGALAAAVRSRGGTIVDGVAIRAIRPNPAAAGVQLLQEWPDGRRIGTFDAVVVATGSWLGDLARGLGVRAIVQAGRGYSFSVPVEHMPGGPLYFPAQRVACTPLGDRLRIAGMMEFRAPDAPLDPRRIRAIANAVRPLLRGADLDSRQDEWVGARPCTADGLPLIGPTKVPGVYVAGGHGMWGITLGPVTGRLLAGQIVDGRRPGELAPFDPLR